MIGDGRHVTRLSLEAAIQKNCDVEKEIKAARKMEAERKAKEATPEKQRQVNQ